MPSLLDNGRAALAKALKDRTMHLAVGIGDEKWDSDDIPAVNLSDMALKNEVGRRLALSKDFVKPDSDGEIVVATDPDESGAVEFQRYSLSEQPTPYLYAVFKFDFGDASNFSLRENAVYIDTVAKNDVPIGTRYLLPEQIESTGEIVTKTHQVVMHMQASTRSTIEIIINL